MSAEFLSAGGNAVLLARRGAPPPRAVPPPALGAFDVPDFDLQPGQRRRADLAAEAAAAVAASQAAALAEARAAGRAEGEAAGRAAAEAAHAAARDTAEAAALAAAAAALGEIAAGAGGAIGAGAEALARLLLGALDAALPAASARLGPDSALRLAEAMRPMLDRSAAVRLFVAPGFAAAVAARLTDERLTVAEDPALAPGDARASWQGGAATAVLADRRAAVAATLASLGLAAEPPPGPETEETAREGSA